MSKPIPNPDKTEIRFLPGLKSRFHFQCKACGTCCGAFTIILSPYDILRLKKATGLSTDKLIDSGIVGIRRESFRRAFGLAPVADFLDVFGISRDDTVPVAALQFRQVGPDKAECHFLEEPVNGKRFCGIYENRPAMCRLHPLGCITVGRRRKWFFRQPLCEVGTEKWQTVEQWLASSGARPFLAANAQFLEWMRVLLIPISRFSSLPEYQREAVERILYNFDSFYSDGQQANLRSIGKMFRQWQSSLAPLSERGNDLC